MIRYAGRASHVPYTRSRHFGVLCEVEGHAGRASHIPYTGELDGLIDVIRHYYMAFNINEWLILRLAVCNCPR
jgi:hypothetical protein